MEQEWEDLPQQLIDVLRDMDITNPEVVVVVGRNSSDQATTRSFANPEGRVEFEGEHHPGTLTVLLAELEMNSPLRCKWNGFRWVCYP